MVPKLPTNLQTKFVFLEGAVSCCCLILGYAEVVGLSEGELTRGRVVTQHSVVGALAELRGPDGDGLHRRRRDLEPLPVGPHDEGIRPIGTDNPPSLTKPPCYSHTIFGRSFIFAPQARFFLGFWLENRVFVNNFGR